MEPNTTVEHPTHKLKWLDNNPRWVAQWPLSKEKLKALEELVDEQEAQGHLEETTSAWNFPVFVIKKPGKDKWRLLHDLREINKIIEDMGPFQPGMPSPTMLPREWQLAVLDIKDCFFQIPLHPEDAPWFALSVPTINREAPMKRYRWKVLPQGLKSSPFICPQYVASLLSSVRAKRKDAIILHYIDDLLVCAPNDSILQHTLDLAVKVLTSAGFQLQEDKVQRMPPGKYLGLQIAARTIVPQKLEIECNPKTLTDLHSLCGSLNWAKLSHQQYHQNVPGLIRQFQLTRSQARAIVATCPNCQVQAKPSMGMGVNPQGLGSCEVWQTDITHIPSFGRLKYVHVSIVTHSGAVYASAHAGEKTGHAKKHLVQAFSVLGIPKEIKTGNGPAYTSKGFLEFVQQWGVEHKTGIPHSPTGQAVVERAHQTLKQVLARQSSTTVWMSPHEKLCKAMFTINFLNCSFENMSPPVVRHFNRGNQFKLSQRPPVMIRDPETWETKGPCELVTWGRGYVCMATPSGPQWIPQKWVKPFVPKNPAPAEGEKAYLTLNPVMNPIQVVILLLLNSLAAAWIIPQPCQNVWVTLAQTLPQENIYLSTASTENPMSTCLARMPLAFLATWAHAGSCSTAVDKDPQILYPLGIIPATMSPALPGVVATEVQDPALGLTEPHPVGLSPLIQPAQIPLQRLPALQQISTPAELGVICKLPGLVLDPLSQVINRGIKQDWPNTEPWGTLLGTSCQLDGTPSGHHSLGPAPQPICHAAKSVQY
ncbi:hypothetical protein DUI87_12671 [Hirundo rustica rustica]|uniref:Uncharacterized protein n=1 Tax=Hirundo rustica rustica TaxID=333673 RepID=A0A3M0K9V6_HIRRU|nr:hypothetical protein DUI87_12671 [Hirundo rustica rustica]